MATTYDLNNRIELGVHPESPYREMYATQEILPGKFLYPASNDEVELLGTPIGIVDTAWIAVANTRAGKTIDDAYAIGERVMIRVLRKGDIVLAWIVGTSIPGIGTPLIPASGSLTVNAGSTYLTIATSMEKWTSITAPERIKVRIV